MDTINVLITTFVGLSLPPTVCLPVPSTTTTSELLSRIESHFLRSSSNLDLNLTTTSNRAIKPCTRTTLSHLTPPACSVILPLRLSAPLRGGKGGFGSQLRAAGGRMSSRKKRSQQSDPAGSARNLDGRRLRTITEAKNLAAYLATKPEMDRKEKEERRKRWEQVVELAEKKEDEMRRGIGADGRRKGLSEEWVESKDEVGENVRNAVAMAMKQQQQQSDQGPPKTQKRKPRIYEDSSGSASGGSNGVSDDSDDGDEDEVMELDPHAMSTLQAEAEAGDADAIWVMRNQLHMEPPRPKKQERRFEGFDDDDEFMSNDEDEDEDDRDEVPESAETKGKAKAVS